MKAREWAEKYNGDLVDLCVEFCAEIMTLIHKRTGGNVSKTAAAVIVGVIREQREKWQAICRQCPDLKSEGFETLLKCAHADLPELEQNYKLYLAKRNGQTASRVTMTKLMYGEVNDSPI